MQNKPKKVILVHGEEDSILNFSNEIKEKFSIPTIIPSYGDVADVTLDNAIFDHLNIAPLPTREKQPEIALPKPVGKNRNVISAIQQMANQTLQLKKEISSSASDRIMDYVNIISKILKEEIRK
jgi:hypothetical protein